MKISTLLNYSGDYIDTAEEVVQLEQAGLDVVFVAEAYRFDAVSMMGYLAAKTNRVQIGSGILPIYSRTPALLAMTAAGVDHVSGGRAILGLGASGPQVIEGWHGVPYDAPLARTREIIEICRKVWQRERLTHNGKKYQIPLPEGQGTGLGKPLKMITPGNRNDIPITVASLTPKSVEMTAEIADGWLPTMFVPGNINHLWKDALAAGQAKRDPSRGPLEVYAGGAVGIGEGLEHLRDQGRPMSALYIGGMGARKKNFYNDVFASYGYEKEAKEIQDLYLSGKKTEAAAAIPAEFIEQTSLIGPEGFVADQIAKYKESGVTCLNVSVVGKTADDRARNVDQLKNLIEKAA